MSWRIVSLRTMVTVLAAVTIGALGVASASSLGGIVPKSITSVNASSSAGTPTVLSCDDFSRAAATGTAAPTQPGSAQPPASDSITVASSDATFAIWVTTDGCCGVNWPSNSANRSRSSRGPYRRRDRARLR